MGSTTSKPEEQPKEHVFKAETPIRLSPELQRSLEETSESNTTRASTTDLHIQQRVTSELNRLLDSTNASLTSASDALSSAPIPTSPLPDVPQSNLGADALAKQQHKEDQLNNLSRENVQKEIDALKEKLKKRRVKEEVVNDKEVEKAKGELVRCLRVKDRRPLDCWEEVEGFKREVGRLEGEWVRGVWER